MSNTARSEMRRLVDVRVAERQHFAFVLRQAAATVTEAWKEADIAAGRLTATIDRYNAVLEEATRWRDGIVAAMIECQGDSGICSANWLEKWESIDLDAAEFPESFEPNLGHADALEALPASPEK